MLVKLNGAFILCPAVCIYHDHTHKHSARLNSSRLYDDVILKVPGQSPTRRLWQARWGEDDPRVTRYKVHFRLIHVSRDVSRLILHRNVVYIIGHFNNLLGN